MGRGRTSETPTDEEILALEVVPVEMAAKYVKSGVATIQYGLQDQRLPFGFAVKNPKTETWTYNISPGGLVKYKHEGCPIIRLGNLQDVITDCVERIIEAKMGGLQKVLSAVIGN